MSILLHHFDLHQRHGVSASSLLLLRFNYSESFRKIKTEQEKVKLNFKSQNNEIYNKDFNLDVLVGAIQLLHDSATGFDAIHYQMLKPLQENSLEILFNIFNYIWTTGKFPEDWQYATIIPIPKPGKDSEEANKFRPIAFTSCLCKTLERMINKILIPAPKRLTS